MRKLSAGVTAVTLLIALSACASNDASSQVSPTADSSIPAIEPSASPNEIQQDAADAYRAALLKSQSSAAASGLTEFWLDDIGDLSQVQAQDPASNKYVVHDITGETAIYVDESAMMPARLLSELDGLINGELDTGSVTSTMASVFEIKNTIDDVVYQTTYRLDDQGRILSADILADDEILGKIKFVYSVTKEAQTALKLAADQAS
jgi:hypothetical protein